MSYTYEQLRLEDGAWVKITVRPQPLFKLGVTVASLVRSSFSSDVLTLDCVTDDALAESVLPIIRNDLYRIYSDRECIFEGYVTKIKRSTGISQEILGYELQNAWYRLENLIYCVFRKYQKKELHEWYDALTQRWESEWITREYTTFESRIYNPPAMSELLNFAKARGVRLELEIPSGLQIPNKQQDADVSIAEEIRRLFLYHPTLSASIDYRYDIPRLIVTGSANCSATKKIYAEGCDNVELALRDDVTVDGVAIRWEWTNLQERAWTQDGKLHTEWVTTPEYEYDYAGNYEYGLSVIRQTFGLRGRRDALSNEEVAAPIVQAIKETGVLDDYFIRRDRLYQRTDVITKKLPKVDENQRQIEFTIKKIKLEFPKVPAAVFQPNNLIIKNWTIGNQRNKMGNGANLERYIVAGALPAGTKYAAQDGTVTFDLYIKVDALQTLDANTKAQIKEIFPCQATGTNNDQKIYVDGVWVYKATPKFECVLTNCPSRTFRQKIINELDPSVSDDGVTADWESTKESGEADEKSEPDEQEKPFTEQPEHAVPGLAQAIYSQLSVPFTEGSVSLRQLRFDLYPAYRYELYSRGQKLDHRLVCQSVRFDLKNHTTAVQFSLPKYLSTDDIMSLSRNFLSLKYDTL